MTGSIENTVIFACQEGRPSFAQASHLNNFSQLLLQDETENYCQDLSEPIAVTDESVDQLDVENYLQDLLENSKRVIAVKSLGPSQEIEEVEEIESEILVSHSDENSVTLSYPFKLTAHGKLDYLESKSELLKREGNVFASKISLSAKEELSIQVGNNSKDHLVNRSVLTRIESSQQQLFMKLTHEPLNASIKEAQANPKSIRKYAEEPKLSVLAAFVSRNISYIRSNDGRTKVVLRDYRADEVSLSLLYGRIRNQLQEHQEVIINGKSQSVDY
ncbi:hypothetical protein [Photobacterium kasasachensis]|uniref:hypothetical protein n=1 Tax=Photobacterium kasasachensis TaxID=2910240 RepID=UPI003D0996E8